MTKKLGFCPTCGNHKDWPDKEEISNKPDEYITTYVCDNCCCEWTEYLILQERVIELKGQQP